MNGRTIVLSLLATAGVAGLVCAGLGIALAGTGSDSRSSVSAAGPEDEVAAPTAGSSAPATPADGGAAAGGTGTGTSVDPAWLADTAAATGIPERALSAYAQAALAAEETIPGCGIGWNTLAGIGFIESEHGSIDGAVLGEDGIARPRILGPALDGTRFDALPDTDDGAVDGDAQWERAVGPMQFLPETWSSYGRDADGDGIADVNQIDDAALGTATMLCTVGGDLTIAENWIRAVDAYNPNIAYNNDVAEAAEHYAAAAG